MTRWIFAFVFICILQQVQAFTIDAKISKSTAELYEEVIVTYTINNTKVQELKFPKLNNFKISGPSTSKNITIINGKFSGSVSYSFFLTPLNTGTFTIPPAIIFVENKKFQTKSLTVKIIDSNNGNGGQTSANPQENKSLKLNEQIFVRAIANKTNVVVGEEVIVSYKIFSTIKYDNMQMVKAPNFNKCLSEDFNIDQAKDPDIETYEGKQYYAKEFRKIALYPTESGNIEIPPILLEGTVYVPSKDPFYDVSIFDIEEPKDVKLYTNVVRLNVAPLPANKPSSFKGSVGKYTINAALNGTPIKGEPITLNVNIKGIGNTKMIAQPVLTFDNKVTTYPPKVDEKIDKNGTNISGEKSYEYLLIPNEIGRIEMPNVVFSYFDVEKRDYVTYNVPLPTLEVKQKKLFSTKKTSIKDNKRLTFSGNKENLDKKEMSPFFYMGMGVIPIFLMFIALAYPRFKNKEKVVATIEGKEDIIQKDFYELASEQINDERKFYEIISNEIYKKCSERYYQLINNIKTQDFNNIKDEYQNIERLYESKLPLDSPFDAYIESLLDITKDTENLNYLKDYYVNAQAQLYSPIKNNINKKQLLKDVVQRIRVLNTSL
jgi:hypothetical protein